MLKYFCIFQTKSLFIFSLLFLERTAFAQIDTVHISIDTKNVIDRYNPIRSYFGYDEANFTTMKDGKKLLNELSQLSKSAVFVRIHNLLFQL